MNKLHITILLLISVTLCATMTKDTNSWERPEVIYPADNPLNEVSIELGGALFFETLMSQDSTISCQSCHLISDAFADHLPVAEGIKGRTVTRNSPTLFNIGLHPSFYE